MAKRTLDIRAKELEETVFSYQKYEACLMQKMPKIITALGENDFCTISKIFEECGVPPTYRKKLLKWAIECYERHDHQW